MTYTDRRGSNSSEVPQPGTVPLFLVSVSWGTEYVCRGRGGARLDGLSFGPGQGWSRVAAWGAWVMVGAWAQDRTTVVNDLCDTGWHLPLSEPCFIHLYLPCWGVSDHVSSDGCSEQVCVLPQSPRGTE